MKHIKEFKLNEEMFDQEMYSKREQHENYEEIEKMFLGDLIEEYEYTDAFLERDEVKKKVDESVKKILTCYDNILLEFNQDMDSKYPIQSPVERWG